MDSVSVSCTYGDYIGWIMVAILDRGVTDGSLATSLVVLPYRQLDFEVP